MKKKTRRNLKIASFLTVIIAAIIATVKLTGGYLPIAKLSETNQQENNETEYQLESDSQKATTTFASNFSNPSISIENAQISAGNTFGVSLKADGSVWTWGNNTYGQLGNGKIENVSTYEPNRVLGINGEGYLENIKQISAGAYTVSALTDDGKVVSWGYNNVGQVGNNAVANSSVPVYTQKQVEVTDEEGNVTKQFVDLDNIVQISRGASHALALDKDGTVWAWGLNNYGELGINVGSTTTSNANYKRIYAVKVQKQIEETNEDGTVTTSLVDLDNIKQVSGGSDFSTALTNDGKVYAWGLGTSGQIGNGAAATVYTATEVSNLENVKKIDAGGFQTIALKEDGTVWSWGLNRYGNLGINIASTTTSNAAYKKTTPVQVLLAASTPIENVVDISSMYETSFALTKDEKVYGWGLNTSGQIGDYTVANKTVATTVKTANGVDITKIKKLADGQYTSFNYMVDENGYIYGSGVSNSYQMMNNRTANTFFAIKLDESYLKLSNNQDYLEVGDNLKLSANYYNGFNINNYELHLGNITYKSSDENIATVDNLRKCNSKSKRNCNNYC